MNEIKNTEEVSIEVEEDADNKLSLQEMLVKSKKMNRNKAKDKRRKLRKQGFKAGF